MPSRESVVGHRDDGSLPVLPFHKELVAHFTGYWPEGWRPHWRRTSLWHLIMMGLSLVGGVLASSLIVLAPPVCWPLLAVSWMLTVHAARKGQVVINHHAVHTNVTGTKQYDHVLAEVVSTLLLIQDYKSYYRDHVQIHHGPNLATLEDPDLQFLLALGFRPGMSREALWRRLYWTVWSPRFHGLFLWARLKANYLTAPRYRRLMAGSSTAAVLAGLALTGAWIPWVIAWVVPIFPLYHVAALLQFICEHKWLQVQELTPSQAREKV